MSNFNGGGMAINPPRTINRFSYSQMLKHPDDEMKNKCFGDVSKSYCG